MGLFCKLIIDLFNPVDPFSLSAPHFLPVTFNEVSEVFLETLLGQFCEVLYCYVIEVPRPDSIQGGFLEANFD